jgi:hypothetical protein
MTGIAAVAVARAADAMLQTLGGTEAVLLFAAAGMPQETASELGLVDPGVEQVRVSPIVVRELPTANNGPRRRIELLMGRRAISEPVSQRNAASAEDLLGSALGVVYRGEVFHIEGFVGEQFGGATYLYRVVAVE